DAEEADYLPVGERDLCDHDVIELDHGLVGHADPKLEWACVDGAEHDSNWDALRNRFGHRMPPLRRALRSNVETGGRRRARPAASVPALQWEEDSEVIEDLSRAWVRCEAARPSRRSPG